MQLVTRRLLLREFRETDVEALYDFERLPQFQYYENDEIPTLEEVRGRVRKNIADAQAIPRTQYRLMVTIPPDETAIGRIKLTLSLEQANEWSIGWGIHPDYWGQGYATEAARAMLEFGFGVLHVHRIMAMCHPDNIASMRVMEKLGMRREARLRGTFWLRGAWQDELMYGILDRDFNQ